MSPLQKDSLQFNIPAVWAVSVLMAQKHVTGDAELETVKERLSGAKNLPEQLFGTSLLRLSHVESGLTLSFTALGALQAWQADDRPPVRVDVADAWMRSRERDVQASGAVSLDYDWCAASPLLSALARVGQGIMTCRPSREGARYAAFESTCC